MGNLCFIDISHETCHSDAINMQTIKKLILLTVSLYGTHAFANAIDMRDYNLLRNGMSEAEILYRLGPADHETVNTDSHYVVLNRTWFYIPEQTSRSKWITELRFDGRGKLVAKDRYLVP